MNTLFFDTETTGKAFFDLPHDDPRQPRMVSVGAILADPQGRDIVRLDLVIRPDGFTIPDEAAKIHGITTEIAVKRGVSVQAALSLFRAMVDSCSTVVAHNIQFDRLILHREAGLGLFGGVKQFCTMEAMTSICNLPGPYGPKWPKLTEAYRHCFKEELDGAHGAFADALACKRIYEWLHKPFCA